MDQEFRDALELVRELAAPLIALLGVWLGWRLGVRSQQVQRRLDGLNQQFAALSEVMKLVDNVPRDLTAPELVARVKSDEEFRDGLVRRLIRLVGLRTEFIPSLDPELVNFIDTKFRPLLLADAGSYELRPDCVVQLGIVAFELRALVRRVEQRLIAEHDRLGE